MSPFWILLELRIVEVVMTTGAVRHVNPQSSCHHQQTNTQLFTGQTTFLLPNQQCQSTEEKKCHIPRTFSSQASRQPQTSSVKRTVAQHCFTGWMPFLSPNQQCQSIEGRYPMQPKYQNYVTLGIYYCSLNLLLLRSSFV